MYIVMYIETNVTFSVIHECLVIHVILYAHQAQLRSRLAALEHALHNKDAEIDSLMQTIALKDGTIKELQQQLQRVMAEKAKLEERLREVEAEKAQLEVSLV